MCFLCCKLYNVPASHYVLKKFLPFHLFSLKLSCHIVVAYLPFCQNLDVLLHNSDMKCLSFFQRQSKAVFIMVRVLETLSPPSHKMSIVTLYHLLQKTLSVAKRLLSVYTGVLMLLCYLNIELLLNISGSRSTEFIDVCIIVMFFLSPEYSVNQDEILFTLIYRLDEFTFSLYLYIQYWLKHEEILYLHLLIV
jgi:hypothetical protein